MRTFLIIYAVVIVATVTILGFRGTHFRDPPWEIFPDMDRQAKLSPQSDTSFFADERVERPVVPGTVPQVPGHLTNYYGDELAWEADYYRMTGLQEDGESGHGIPYEVTNAFMELGQEKYTIFCEICHGASGNGQGVMHQFQWAAIASLHQDALRDPSELRGTDGHLYDVITNGWNTMYPYGSKLRVHERWAVVAYVRALQRAQMATMEDVPLEMRGEMN